MDCATMPIDGNDVIAVRRRRFVGHCLVCSIEVNVVLNWNWARARKKVWLCFDFAGIAKYLP